MRYIRGRVSNGKGKRSKVNGPVNSAIPVTLKVKLGYGDEGLRFADMISPI